jgi:site-specific recombinase XerC
LNVSADSGVTSRVVSIPQELVPVLERFVRLYRAGVQPAEALLWSERGTPFGYMSLYSKVRRIGQDAGLGLLHPAMLRHAFLVRLYEKEQDLRLVRGQAGHARLRSTARHVCPRRPPQQCEACGKSLSPGLGRKIDSGQLLCPTCLRELRQR